MGFKGQNLGTSVLLVLGVSLVLCLLTDLPRESLSPYIYIHFQFQPNTTEYILVFIFIFVENFIICWETWLPLHLIIQLISMCVTNLHYQGSSSAWMPPWHFMFSCPTLIRCGSVTTPPHLLVSALPNGFRIK